MTDNNTIQYLNENNPNTDNLDMAVPMVLEQFLKLKMVKRTKNGRYIPTNKGRRIFNLSVINNN